MNRIEIFQKKLIKYPTNTEVFFYNKLLERFSNIQKKYRFPFIRRQVLIGWYIVDFLLPYKTLIIELDGEQHFSIEGKTDDAIRDGWLKEIGFDVLRYSNKDIMNKYDEIIDYIDLWRSLDNPFSCFYESRKFIRTVNYFRHKGKLQRFAKSKELD